MRNLEKTEQVVLFKQKVKQGESENQAIDEVKRDVDYISSLKKQVSDKKKEIYRLEKEKDNLNEKFKKEFEKLQKSKDRLDKPMKIRSKSCTVRHLNRILTCLDENYGFGITRIRDYCCMDNGTTREGLNFLLRHNLIKEKYDSGNYTYEKC